MSLTHSFSPKTYPLVRVHPLPTKDGQTDRRQSCHFIRAIQHICTA